MRLIDFRARPNTEVYMRMCAGPGSERTWQRFGYPPPPAVPLQEFAAALRANGITYGVFTGRQTYQDGQLLRGFPNDYVAECRDQFPDQIMGFAGIDCMAGEAAVAEVDRAITRLGLSGISLDMHYAGVLADDQRIFPIYARAAQLGVPVVLTMGPLVGRSGDPWAVDRVAAEFPQLTLVLSHGCWPQVTELVALAYRRDNVYLEASIYEFLPGAEPFIAAANTIIQDRVIYASAFPYNPLEIIQEFRKFPFSSTALDKILWQNSARLLGLQE